MVGLTASSRVPALAETAVRGNHWRRGSAPNSCHRARNTSQEPWLGGQKPPPIYHATGHTHFVPHFIPSGANA